MFLRICEFLPQIYQELLEHRDASHGDDTKEQAVHVEFQCGQSFWKPKEQAFTSAPILLHADLEKPFIIEADASNFAIGSILSQVGDDGKLHPIAFHSRKFEAVEINYEIHDKELLAIKDSFEQWRHLLEGSHHQIIVNNDHKRVKAWEWEQLAMSLT